MSRWWDGQFFAKRSKGRVFLLSELISLYSRGDEKSETLLGEKLSELRVEGWLSFEESRSLERLRDLVLLRSLAFGKRLTGKRGLLQSFTVGYALGWPRSPISVTERFDAQEIMESAVKMADLYWKLYATCASEHRELRKVAFSLYESLFHESFDAKKAHERISAITDLMQREGGIAFLILNFLKERDWARAKQLGQALVLGELKIDQELVSPFYWMSELLWFVNQDSTALTDFHTSLRYLYHLCFSNADRVGFLEIDSPYFSDFRPVAEVALEAFLYKESLFESVLMAWPQYGTIFGSVFQETLEILSERKTKIADNKAHWDIFWKREKEIFSREYLYLVEGNICFSDGEYEDALTYYELALSVNPKQRAALLNRVHCYARLGRVENHHRVAQALLEEKHLLPASLYVAGNSYLLLGNTEASEACYERLAQMPGWETKTDYYRSTFCQQNGLKTLALRYARAAFEVNPSDAPIRYHLSICYNENGQKEQALDLISTLPTSEAGLEWLNYYRFTLERDSGRLQEASETLLKIPREYFDNPEELAAAIEFAKRRQDLALLRHLKSKV